LDKLKGENEDQRHGVEIVKKAISWPARQIAINAGEDGSIQIASFIRGDPVVGLVVFAFLVAGSKAILFRLGRRDSPRSDNAHSGDAHSDDKDREEVPASEP
jgi:chaperonin GroEL (HSP60 family)